MTSKQVSLKRSGFVDWKKWRAMGSFMKGLEVKQSTLANAGLGLFAKGRDFQPRDYICQYEGHRLTREQADTVTKEGKWSHLYPESSDFVIDGYRYDELLQFWNEGNGVSRGPGAMANDSRGEKPYNAAYVVLENRDNEPTFRAVILQASREIKDGEEVFIPYGSLYWVDYENELARVVDLSPRSPQPEPEHRMVHVPGPEEEKEESDTEEEWPPRMGVPPPLSPYESETEEGEAPVVAPPQEQTEMEELGEITRKRKQPEEEPHLEAYTPQPALLYHIPKTSYIAESSIAGPYIFKEIVPNKVPAEQWDHLYEWCMKRGPRDPAGVEKTYAQRILAQLKESFLMSMENFNLLTLLRSYTLLIASDNDRDLVGFCILKPPYFFYGAQYANQLSNYREYSIYRDVELIRQGWGLNYHDLSASAIRRDSVAQLILGLIFQRIVEGRANVEYHNRLVRSPAERASEIDLVDGSLARSLAIHVPEDVRAELAAYVVDWFEIPERGYEQFVRAPYYGLSYELALVCVRERGNGVGPALMRFAHNKVCTVAKSLGFRDARLWTIPATPELTEKYLRLPRLGYKKVADERRKQLLDDRLIDRSDLHPLETGNLFEI